MTLEFAALFSPDQVPLPWLRVLVAEDFPELASDAEPGYSDPWKNVVHRLFSLRPGPGVQVVFGYRHFQ